ncbi:uncharacterized protein LOC143575957 [Bidens hawaiensis]|uniref:uncharacterized protein LOC143575957 n=1 Tax=Bidens hawaiensis TaxID=980011 RepID=UPI00404965D0
MECNRDEAKRSKEIAEEKFSRKDITGAKKFALKAQNLYPGLDGISQFIAVLDVYVAAENKINEETDLYGILGLDPLADDDTVKRHYRKLALSLHPDKNKSIGAEGAFQFVSQAMAILSDKDKRSIYDLKRRVPKPNWVFQAPKPPTHNGFHNSTKSKVTSKVTKSKVTSAKAKNPPKDATTKSETGPTKMETGPTETAPASVRSSINEPKTFWTVCKRCKLQHEYTRDYMNLNLLCPTCHGPFHATETAPPNSYVSSETCKITGHGTSTQRGPIQKTNGGTKKRDREEVHKGEEGSRRKIPKSSKQDDNKRGSVEVSIKNQLLKIATIEIKKKLNEWSSEAAKDAEMVNGSETVETDVPDPEFHDFDSSRSEDCFKEGQVWAVYDDHDGMPRLYAIINKVMSLNPFKMYVCWLDPKPDNNRMRAFGEFKPGNLEIISAPNYFSHKANFTKLTSGNIRVFPRKGGVCALYKNDETYEIVAVDDYDEEIGIVVTPLVKVSGFKSVFHRHLDQQETRVILEKEISHEIPSCLLTGQENAKAPKGCLELDPAAVPPEFLQVKGISKW